MSEEEKKFQEIIGKLNEGIASRTDLSLDCELTGIQHFRLCFYIRWNQLKALMGMKAWGQK